MVMSYPTFIDEPVDSTRLSITFNNIVHPRSPAWFRFATLASHSLDLCVESRIAKRPTLIERQSDVVNRRQKTLELLCKT